MHACVSRTFRQQGLCKYVINLDLLGEPRCVPHGASPDAFHNGRAQMRSTPPAMRNRLCESVRLPIEMKRGLTPPACPPVYLLALLSDRPLAPSLGPITAVSNLYFPA